jgi:5-methylcytosine-specific restriction endonuclease McrA
MSERRHNWGMECSKRQDCVCAKCCICTGCLFDRRSASLYRGMQSRFGQKLWKTGKREGTIRREKRDIPFSLDQFRAWLRVVLEDTPHCTYCGASINISTITPDHAIPIKRGGSLALANLRECCQPCQGGKGDLKPGEWTFLMKCVATMPEAARVSIMRRLRGGILHFGSRKVEPKATNVLAIPAKKV